MSAEAVYLVTAGEYSDYHVEAAFSTLEKAKAACDQYSRVESFWLDATPSQGRGYLVTMLQNGEVQNVYPCSIDGPTRVGFRHWGWADYRDHSKGEALEWVVKTTDKKRAVKVVNEKRAAILAADLWGKPLAGRIK